MPPRHAAAAWRSRSIARREDALESDDVVYGQVRLHQRYGGARAGVPDGDSHIGGGRGAGIEAAEGDGGRAVGWGIDGRRGARAGSVRHNAENVVGG